MKTNSATPKEFVDLLERNLLVSLRQSRSHNFTSNSFTEKFINILRGNSVHAVFTTKITTYY